MAQRGRLEDQRGTEIKFEMPDFLKRGTVSELNFLKRSKQAKKLSQKLLINGHPKDFASNDI